MNNMKKYLKSEKNTKKHSTNYKIPKQKYIYTTKITKQRRQSWYILLCIMLLGTQLMKVFLAVTEKINTPTIEHITVLNWTEVKEVTLNQWNDVRGTSSVLETEHWNSCYFRLTNRKQRKWSIVMGWVSNKNRNRIVKVRNGNGGGVKQVLKLKHWSVGNSWWKNKCGNPGPGTRIQA